MNYFQDPKCDPSKCDCSPACDNCEFCGIVLPIFPICCAICIAANCNEKGICGGCFGGFDPGW